MDRSNYLDYLHLRNFLSREFGYVGFSMRGRSQRKAEEHFVTRL